MEAVAVAVRDMHAFHSPEDTRASVPGIPVHAHMTIGAWRSDAEASTLLYLHGVKHDSSGPSDMLIMLGWGEDLNKKRLNRELTISCNMGSLLHLQLNWDMSIKERWHYQVADIPIHRPLIMTLHNIYKAWSFQMCGTLFPDREALARLITCIIDHLAP